LKSFKGNQVLRVVPTTQEHVEILQTHRTAAQLDFWSDDVAIGGAVDIHVPKCMTKSLYKELADAGLNVTVWIPDVQILVDRQKEPSADWLAQYHTYADVLTWVKQLPRRFPHLVSLVPLGKSHEGRDLLAVQLTSNKTKNPVGLWYDGGLHAREWITVATVLWMTNQLLEDYGNDPVVTALLDNLVITVLPIFNPDGYDFTWTNNRMWRKTRSPNSGTSCIGTDPNRNWDFHWGGAGSSSNPCDDSYMGAYAFSEIEVRTVAGYIKAQGNIQGYINFHSYSQLWMSPWGWTTALPKDYKKQNDLSAQCVQALGKVFGTQYEYGPIATTIYPAAGSSADWTYGVCGTLYSYGVELRDTGDYGFLLPPNQIVPSGQETYAALKVFAQAVQKVQL
jgi:murein tripeptide amidase MpaA